MRGARACTTAARTRVLALAFVSGHKVREHNGVDVTTEPLGLARASPTMASRAITTGIANDVGPTGPRSESGPADVASLIADGALDAAIGEVPRDDGLVEPCGGVGADALKVRIPEGTTGGRGP